MDLYIAVRTDHDMDVTDVAYVETSEGGMRRLLAMDGWRESHYVAGSQGYAMWEDDDNRSLYVEHWVPSVDEPVGFKWIENLGPEGGSAT